MTQHQIEERIKWLEGENSKLTFWDETAASRAQEVRELKRELNVKEENTFNF